MERYARVGFDVRLHIRLTQTADHPSVLVTLTRADATSKQLVEGAQAWIKPVAGASRVKISEPVVPVVALELAVTGS